MIESMSAKLKSVSQIVAAYASRNTVAQDELPRLIDTVFRALDDLERMPESAAELTPAVSVRSSLKRDRIVCLECGYQGKMLKRHISRAHDLSPNEYRAKWGLSSSYPMVAPAYSAARSEMAKKIGLGTKTGKRR
jgi:predicted transcriptional regulator